MIATLRKAMKRESRIVSVLELGAKLNKEIGSGVLPDEVATTVVFVQTSGKSASPRSDTSQRA